VGALLAQHLPPPRTLRLLSSPQGRARRTAELVGQALGLTVEIEPRLCELSIGRWDGMTMAEIDVAFPGALAGTTRHDWYFRAPDCERYETACDRLSSWLAEVNEPTIAVSHGLSGRLLRGLYAGLDRATALALPVPQDGAYRLAGGQIEFLQAPD
jgi:probable phosphoglycerate mutase